MKPVVLVSTRDAILREFLDYVLGTENYDILSADGVEKTLRVALRELPHLILFDCRSQPRAGVEFCIRLRRNPAAGSISVVALVESDAGREKDLLGAGANECIATPVTAAKLTKRLQSQADRLHTGSDPRLLRHADIEMNLATHRVHRDGRPIELGPTEFRLLRHFMEQPGKVFSRNELIAGAWANSVDLGSRTVDVHVGRLRRALSTRSAADPIRTVRSFGYALSDEDDAEDS